MRDDLLPELSAVEQLRARGGEALERAGKVRLLRARARPTALSAPPM